MEVAMPITGSAIDCYEDMFKEITRKLYGEDGLPDLSSNDRLPSTSQDRGLTPIDYDVDNPILKSEEHLTAFGLAALMQNGFPPTGILNPNFQTHKNNVCLTLTAAEDKWVSSDDTLQWTQSKIATYNPLQKLFRCAECNSVGYLLRVAEHWLGTHSNLRAFHCPQCSYESAWSRCVRVHLNRQHNVIHVDEATDPLTKDNPVLQEIIKYLQRLKTKIENINCNKPNNDDFPNQQQNNITPSNIHTVPNQLPNNNNNIDQANPVSTNKRYSCTFCPYATDRRDLFTRHENIHREEKPFQCYVCQKQFNRADHVKKHFLRMHRDHPYDLNRIRRHPPKNASGMSYYQKYNSNTTSTNVPNNETLNNVPSIGSLSIPGFNNVNRTPNVSGFRQSETKPKNTNGSKNSSKKKGEKRFTCCYCSWSGVDNWCLKRHMNTHLKPFVCGLCDYKAARSERLATHVLKVHNKRACAKCNFLADDLVQLTTHQQEHHPIEHKNRSSSNNGTSNNVLRNNVYNNSVPAAITGVNTAANSTFNQTQTILKNSDITAATAHLLQHNRFLQSEVKSWKSHTPKQHGAARLFNYMEASDGSEPESDTPRPTEVMSSGVNLTHRIQSDFPEAGDASSRAVIEEENGDETELPLFVCPTCGCEFEDDSSLETHQYTHQHNAASPAKIDDSKENIDPYLKYTCRICKDVFESQNDIMSHMMIHTTLGIKPSVLPIPLPRDKRSRKQSQPRKFVLPYWDTDEVEILRHLNGKLRKWRYTLSSDNSRDISKLIDKNMAQLVTRQGLICKICRYQKITRYHTKASLALHYLWRHSKKMFQCEHCDMKFKHRYQTILHSSRVHTDIKPTPQPFTLPVSKEMLHISLDAVPSSQDINTFTNFFSSSHNIPVPDTNMSNAHKLGVSFFDHSFIHSNPISNQMPIIIPTFPPN